MSNTKIKIKVNLISETLKSYIVKIGEGEFIGVKESMPKTTSTYTDGYLETDEWSWKSKIKDYRNGKFFLKQDIVSEEFKKAVEVLDIKNPIELAKNYLNKALEELNRL